MQTMKVLATRMPDEHIEALRAVAEGRETNVSIEMRRAVKAFVTSEGQRLGLRPVTEAAPV
jgi:predicted transcriptional regulator